MSYLRKCEKDESSNLQRIVDDMNRLHATMGGRDRRPERVALAKAMTLLTKAIETARRNHYQDQHRGENQ